MTTPAEQSSIIWNLTQARNPNFVGRETLLNELHQKLGRGHRVQAIHGLGGVGKSQIALEYAHRHALEYSLIWWIRADSHTSISAAYSKLAARLGRHISVEAAPSVVRETVDSVLSDRATLLIFDGAPDAPTIEPFLLSGRSVHVLITSRSANWAGVAEPQPLRVLGRADAVAFLLQRTGRKEPAELADRLAHALGDLPLALEQAAATIKQSSLSFGDYLTRFETEWAQMLMEGQRPPDYPYSVAMTWGLAFNAVEKASPAAAELLNLCAFLASHRIGIKMLREGQQFLPKRLQSVVASPSLWADAVAPLLNYSLVDIDEQNFNVHRLVATVTRDRLETGEQAAWCSAAIVFLTGSFKFDSSDVASWSSCGELLPHIIEATAHADRLKILPDESAQLLNNAGRYLLKKAQYADAKSLLERAMTICAQRYGEKHPKLSSIANNLGRAHQNLGDDNVAMQYFGHALTIDETAYGHAHPHVAEVINNYGICMQKKGDREMARQQFQWAAEVYEAHYGPNHPKLAHILNNLGYALKSLGDVEGAQLHLTRALTIAEMTVGTNHPTTARVLYNLGAVNRMSAQLAVARDYFERALKIDETTLGPSHPDVAGDCIALAEVLTQLGQGTAAVEYAERAKRIESALNFSAA